MTKGMVYWMRYGVCSMVWDAVDRIVGEDVLYAHEVRNRGVKRLCCGCVGNEKGCEGRFGGRVYGMDRYRVRCGSA